MTTRGRKEKRTVSGLDSSCGRCSSAVASVRTGHSGHACTGIVAHARAPLRAHAAGGGVAVGRGPVGGGHALSHAAVGAGAVSAGSAAVASREAPSASVCTTASSATAVVKEDVDTQRSQCLDF